MFKIYDGRQLFYQWDLNRKLLVGDSSITQVHFSNWNRDTALVLEVYELDGHRVVDVPNILLQEDCPIDAYAYLDDHTRRRCAFKVAHRPKPEEYVYTETEVLTAYTMMDRTEKAATAADESAGNAADSEQSAKTSAESADQSAKAAAESAEKAAQSESNTATSEQNAKTAETAAESAKEETVKAAADAKTSAGNAATSEQNAETAKETAVNAADRAAQAEENAGLSEQNAAKAAEEAAKIVELAKHSDWNAAEREPGHVLNRTHYDEFVEILPETTLEDEGGGSYLLAESALPFVAGEEYIVNFNGTEYTVECVDMSAAVGGAPAKAFLLGSMEFPPPEGEPPFGIMVVENVPDEEDMTAVVAGSDYEGQPITFGIKQRKTVKLPERYLPDSVFEKAYYVEVINTDDTYSTDALASDLAAAHDAGLPIFARVRPDSNAEAVTIMPLSNRLPYFSNMTIYYFASLGVVEGIGFLQLVEIADGSMVCEYIPQQLPTKLSELKNDDGYAKTATASVGQTIRVTEVDESGKPTAWEAVDYQPRTHWTEETEILPETTPELDAENGLFSLPEITLEAGKEYVVNYNSTEYVSTAVDLGEGVIAIGNVPLIMETGDNKNPFIITYEYGWFCMPLDGATALTISIVEVNYTPIPMQYVANVLPFYVDVDYDTLTYTGSYSAADIVAAIESGRHIIGRCSGINTVWAVEAPPVVRSAQDGEGALAFIFRDIMTPGNYRAICMNVGTDGTITVEAITTD